ncbi:MAG: hypothetical protein QOE68_4224, partial [Thermoanaerobaculia bacterium]|nr:hypothetical protein [Thermoanaerobaculia bacterium]
MKRISIAFAALLLLAPVAHGANCKWNTVPTNMNFGNYSVFGGQATANSSWSIN